MTSRISNEEMNFALNCTKIYPIDQNTGIINGIHLRVFETIGAGALPVMEWRKDLDNVFEGLLPVIKQYSKSRDLAMFYLQNEQKRLDTISSLQYLIKDKYTPELYIRRVINKI
jgi:hypothetical protein